MRRFISITATLGILSGLWLTAPAMQVGAALPSTTVPGTTIAPATRGTTAQIAPTLPPPATVATPQAPSPLVAPPNSGEGRRVVYSKGSMRVWIIEPDGQVLISYLVSGRRDQPSYGTYSVYSRSAFTCSTTAPNVCRRWMVRFAKGPAGDNIGFHEIPVKNGVPVQSDSQLGQPLSGGCVRQSTWDAFVMWNWANVGTKVVVIP